MTDALRNLVGTESTGGMLQVRTAVGGLDRERRKVLCLIDSSCRLVLLPPRQICFLGHPCLQEKATTATFFASLN